MKPRPIDPILAGTVRLKQLVLALALGLGAGTALAIPANDDFANAIDLTGAGTDQTGSLTSGTQTGTDTIDATVETGEPAIFTATKTVWFKWTSPGAGDFTFDTTGSTNGGATEWDSMIGIYTGATVDALTPLGETPKDMVVPESMTIPVASGTTYYIQLAGFEDEDAANILLTWNYTSEADILSFGPGATIGTVVSNAADIDWEVPFGTDLSILAPTFTLSTGATCTVDATPVSSGDPIDFSGGPKDYVVTSSDAGIVNTYTVTVTVGPPPTDGTWITDGDGNWSDTANWLDGIVANGVGTTADFTLSLTANRTATLDTPRTIGNITKDDTSSDNNRLIIAGSETLTLDVTSGSPVLENLDSNFNLGFFQVSAPIAGNDGLTIDGPGAVYVTNNSTNYTGPTTINGGYLFLGAIDMENIGGGAAAGRNITMAAGSILQRNWQNMKNDVLSRVVETTDTIGIFLTATGGSLNNNDLDFSGTNGGADLPNAFLGTYATNGAKSQYNGIITPASDAYRWGHPSQGGSLHIAQAHGDVVTPRGLIVGGGAVILGGQNTFTGDTVLQAGRLFLGRQLCLQNSALNVGNGAGDGITGQFCFLNSGGGGLPEIEVTDQPTIGGLIGARNLASIYNSANQNNTARLAIGSVVGMTLDVDTGKTHTYSGNARLSTGMYLTKTGAGTQVLSGNNDYTGATSVNVGTLALVGGSQASPITVASGASLGFMLGSPVSSSSSVDLTNGTVKITGSVDNSSDYQLMTASGGFVGTPTLDSPITDYALQLQGSDTELWLVFTGGAANYATWATTNSIDGEPFTGDFNGDGITNGVAYALGLSPTASSQPAGVFSGNTITFTKGADAIANADVTWIIETSETLGAGSWTPEVTQAAGDVTATISYTFTPGTPVKKFARLKAVQVP